MKRSLENMNIALVHEWITNVAGSERVLLVLKELFPDAPIFTSVYAPEKAKPFNKYEVHTSFLQKIPFMKTKRELLIPFTPLAFEQFDLSKFDLVISSTSMAAKGVITKPDTIHVSYCHTPPRYLWEAQIDPRAKGGMLAGIKSLTSHKMRIWDRVAADRVDHFLANSKYVAGRIKKYYDRDADVVYPPVNCARFNDCCNSNIGNYFLFVSRLVNYKKCDLVIAAFNKLGWPLKIIGTGPDKSKLESMAKKNIEFLGFLSDEEIKKYYAETKAFIFAAEEDFGIVPVEAMAAGRPVIAYARGGQSESVVPGVTGEFFPEQTADSLVQTLKYFDYKKYDPAKIKAHANKFSEEIFKKNILDVLEKII